MPARNQTTVQQGATLVVPVAFKATTLGPFVDPDSAPTWIIKDPSGATAATGTGTKVSLGHWQATWPVSASAQISQSWAIYWTAYVGGVLVPDAWEYFIVVAPTATGAPALIGSLPVAANVREELEGYGISAAVVSDAWINGKIANTVLPWVEQVTRLSIHGVQTVEELLDGNGSDILMLSRRPILSLVKIALIVSYDTPIAWTNSNFSLDPSSGRVKLIYTSLAPTGATFFPKGNQNIKAYYTCGYADGSIPTAICEAVKLLACEKTLGIVSGRTGGGDLGVQAFNRSYGPRGKYSHLRDDFAREARALLRPYMTGVAGA